MSRGRRLRRPELAAQRWYCTRLECYGSKHTVLRTTLTDDGGVVEVFKYTCGHRDTRVVGHLLPDSVFQAIERRLDRHGRQPRPSRALAPLRGIA